MAKRPKPEPQPKPDRVVVSKLDLQLGPTQHKPGSLLIEKKRKAPK